MAIIRISMKQLTKDVDKNFARFGAEIGYGRNWKEIHGWKKSGFCSYEEEKALLSYNRTRYMEEYAMGNR